MTNLSLRSIDIPQLHRFGVGFDRMIDHMEELMRASVQNSSNYPPYNIVKHNENIYTIEIAVAGFKQGDISIELKEDQLIIEGKQNLIDPDDETKEYLHRGISSRSFVRYFTLAEHVEVRDAKQEDGVLIISLERIVPEEKKPKSIAITYVK